MARPALDLKPVREVPVSAVPVDAFADVLGDGPVRELQEAAEHLKGVLGPRTIWNLNSTASGGGVAELLQPLTAYSRGLGVDVRWLVMTGDPEFFAITKRLHHNLHGWPGDEGQLGPPERRHYHDVCRWNCEQVAAFVRPGDVVICHDPQPVGLLPLLVEHGARVVWRSHIGAEASNEHTERGWAFVLDEVLAAHHWVFSRGEYVPDFLDEGVTVIPPSIDPFSPKNHDLAVAQQRAILGRVGILCHADTTDTTFARRDGSPGRVDHIADIVRGGPAPDADTPLVVQVSRWDPLKDMAGVMHAFAEHVDHGAHAQLVLAGPNVGGVSDDPEGAAVLDDCIEQWRDLPHSVRARIALVSLPMADPDENAVIVNALQRHATVVAQKSLHEGFGLTVAEAMWKARPVVGGAVGGIQDQVVDEETGRLVDPTDLDAFGQAIAELVADQDRADELGRAARQRVEQQFLGPRHLLQWADVLLRLVDGEQ